ncbi:MAG: hypothetical protein IPO41_08865 [Acidobacteria bacterium]|nr:hypothetical protein [Acidobacteriota bacterium]
MEFTPNGWKTPSIVRFPKVDLGVVQRYQWSICGKFSLLKISIAISYGFGRERSESCCVSIVAIEHQEKILRLQVIGYRLDGLGGPRNRCGAATLKCRYEW